MRKTPPAEITSSFSVLKVLSSGQYRKDRMNPNHLSNTEHRTLYCFTFPHEINALIVLNEQNVSTHFLPKLNVV